MKAGSSGKKDSEVSMIGHFLATNSSIIFESFDETRLGLLASFLQGNSKDDGSSTSTIGACKYLSLFISLIFQLPLVKETQKTALKKVPLDQGEQDLLVLDAFEGKLVHFLKADNSSEDLYLSSVKRKRAVLEPHLLALDRVLSPLTPI